MSYKPKGTKELRRFELWNLLEKSKGSGLTTDECEIVSRLAGEFEVGLNWQRLGLDGSINESIDYGLLKPPPPAPRWSGETSYDKSMRLIREKVKREQEKKADAKAAKKKRTADLSATQQSLF